MKRHEPRQISFDHARFYEAIKREAKARGLSMWDVGIESGVDHSTISKVQKRNPDVVTAAALAKWSGLDVAQFSIDREAE